jgi:hypothetical protein
VSTPAAHEQLVVELGPEAAGLDWPDAGKR